MRNERERDPDILSARMARAISEFALRISDDRADAVSMLVGAIVCVTNASVTTRIAAADLLTSVGQQMMSIAAEQRRIGEAQPGELPARQVED